MQKEQEANVEFLEDKLKLHTGRKYVVACSNGTDALHFALISLGIKRYPQDSQTTTALSPFTITSSTLKKDTRARGRFVSVKIENDAVNESWRFGTLRLDLQADGRR